MATKRIRKQRSFTMSDDTFSQLKKMAKERDASMSQILTDLVVKESKDIRK